MRNWPKKCGALLVLMACISCQDASDRQGELAESDGAETEGIAGEVATSTYTTEGGGSFTVTSMPFSASLAKVSVETQGFDFDEVYELGALDPVDRVFLADLDKNGFQEIYIVTRSAGSGSHQSIFGVASDENRSTGPVRLPELERGELLEGFMGHNRFVLDDRGLVEVFPRYERGDTNVAPSGGERRIQYALIKGKAGWILKPVSIEDVAPSQPADDAD